MSDYSKCLPILFYAESSKNRQNCRLCLDIFSSAIMHDLTMTLTSRLKIGTKYANQHAVKLHQIGELFWDSPS